MITKSVKRLLLAALAISLFAGSALAAEPSPWESQHGGTVTFQISFDLEAEDGLVTNAEAGRSQKNAPYAPEFTKLEAYTKGISGALAGLVKATNDLSNVDSGDAKDRSALVELMHMGDLYGTLFKNDTLKYKIASKLIGQLLEGSNLATVTTDHTAGHGNIKGMFDDRKRLDPKYAEMALDLALTSDEVLAQYVWDKTGGFTFSSPDATAAKITSSTVKTQIIAAAKELAKIDFGDDKDGVNAALAEMAYGNMIIGIANMNGNGLKTAISADVAKTEKDSTAPHIPALNTALTSFAKALASADKSDTFGAMTTGLIDYLTTGKSGGSNFSKAVQASLTSGDKFAALSSVKIREILEATSTLADAFEENLDTLKTSISGVNNNAVLKEMAAITLDNLISSLRVGVFWGYAAINPDAFKAMLPAISEYLAGKPTATMVELAGKIADDINPATNAVDAYLTSFLSKDALNDGKAAIEWSSDVTFKKPDGKSIVNVMVLGGKNPTITPAFVKAEAVSASVKDTIKSPAILRVELASKDNGKFVYGPVDVTEGIEVTDALLAQKEVVGRAILLAPGYVDTEDKVIAAYQSIGILKEGDDKGYDGTLPKNTLDNSLYNGDLEGLTKAYPYFVEFTMRFVVSGDASGSGSEGGTEN